MEGGLRIHGKASALAESILAGNPDERESDNSRGQGESGISRSFHCKEKDASSFPPLGSIRTLLALSFTSTQEFI